MKVLVESVFPCSPSWAWEKVQTTSLFRRIIKPLLGYEAVEGSILPEIWQEGSHVDGRLLLFGFLPAGPHAVDIEELNAETRELQTSEGGTLLKSWRHRIRVKDAVDGQTLYSDEIDIDAGWMTPLAWLFAHVFYRHRHRQWKKIIQEEKQLSPA